MRFKSKPKGGFQIFAVAGTNTVSFAIDFADADIEGLLGFAVERVDPAEDERYFVYGFKVFPSVLPKPDRNTVVFTDHHPIQSFVWDDFTAKDDHAYEYIFHPLKGKPKKLDWSAPPISIKVRTEPLFTDLEHDVFFNRGVASSQAYAREFKNQAPDKITDPRQRQRAFDWLSRNLDDAILKFIANAKKGDTLLGCFYEFQYAPVADALRDAIRNGVNVQLIIDGKVNEHTDKKGFHESAPREANIRTLAQAKIGKANHRLREAKPNDIAHNKFMVLLKGKKATPKEVWTGSTNLSTGGIHGQTNVGHWLRNPAVATAFKAYWDLLWTDPGPKATDNRAAVVRLNKELRQAVEALGAVPISADQIAAGVTPVFSPRSGSAVLDMYAKMVSDAENLACITLAFGVGAPFKKVLGKRAASGALAFMLLEKEDKPNPRSTTPFVRLNARNNVYQAFGSFIRDPLYHWTRETNAKSLGLNKFVSYVHSKFLLMDPLGLDPIVVTGSANFSDPSTNDNDENMLVIRGNQRVADIYFTEFNRLFFHYYFRSIQEITLRRDPAPHDDQTLFLDETGDWTKRYATGSLRRKRVEVLSRGKGFKNG